LLNLLDPAFGLAGASFPEKIEGLAFGPDLADGRHLLLVSADNDFVGTTPSRVFAFALDATLLDYTPQSLHPALSVRPFLEQNVVSLRVNLPFFAAVYGDTFLPVAALDTASLRLANATAKRCTSLDLDRDGQADLLCTFRPRELGVTLGEQLVTLSGKTTSGTPVSATDMLRVVR